MMNITGAGTVHRAAYSHIPVKYKPLLRKVRRAEAPKKNFSRPVGENRVMRFYATVKWLAMKKAEQ